MFFLQYPGSWFCSLPHFWRRARPLRPSRRRPSLGSSSARTTSSAGTATGRTSRSWRQRTRATRVTCSPARSHSHARDGGSATKAYVSRDGGIVWNDVIFPEQREMGGGDPQVAFSAVGTALFATLATGPDETGRTRAFLHSYRSEDGGATWSDVYNLGASYDHPMLVADQTTGPFSGRLYMSVLYGGIEYSLGVFRSEDDGRSWIGPVKFIDGAGGAGAECGSHAGVSRRGHHGAVCGLPVHSRADGWVARNHACGRSSRRMAA